MGIHYDVLTQIGHLYLYTCMNIFIFSFFRANTRVPTSGKKIRRALEYPARFVYQFLNFSLNYDAMLIVDSSTYGLRPKVGYFESIS